MSVRVCVFIVYVCVTCLFVHADSNTTANITAMSSSDTSDGMGYNGMGYNGMGYNGMGYNGMGYNGMGYNGMSATTNKKIIVITTTMIRTNMCMYVCMYVLMYVCMYVCMYV